jgi:hypothetical protein
MPMGWNPKWGSELSRPITVDNGIKLHTLRDARQFILALPRIRHSRPWEIAAERLVAAAESGSADALAMATRAVEYALRYDQPPGLDRSAAQDAVEQRKVTSNRTPTFDKSLPNQDGPGLARSGKLKTDR